MFIYIKHRDNQVFLVNLYCPIRLVLHYIRARVGLRGRETMDLCDESGTLKMFFTLKSHGFYAFKYLTPRKTYYVCRVERGPPGTKNENAYRSIVPILHDPEPELLDTLRVQCDILERNRLKALRIAEAKKVAIVESTTNLSAKSGKSNVHIQLTPPPSRRGLRKGKVDFHGRKRPR